MLNFTYCHKDKVRRKLWLNETGLVYKGKDGNVDNKRIWSRHPSRFMFMFTQSISITGKCILIDI